MQSLLQEQRLKCRFTKDLPPGLNEFNNTCLRQQRARGGLGLQNSQAISYIIREAKHLAGQAAAAVAAAEEEEEDTYDYMTDEAMAQDGVCLEEAIWNMRVR